MAEIATQTAPAVTHTPSYVEWSPVFAGALLATATSVVLLQFGAAVGLAAREPLTAADGTVSWIALVGGLWAVWVAVVSVGLGGYVAGRMRSRWAGASDSQAEFRDGVHGLAVWALATLAAAIGFAAISALTAPTAIVVAVPENATAEMQRLAANASVIFGFSTAAGAAISAAVGWFAAAAGGGHRDEDFDHNSIVPGPFRSQPAAKS